MSFFTCFEGVFVIFVFIFIVGIIFGFVVWFVFINIIFIKPIRYFFLRRMTVFLLEFFFGICTGFYSSLSTCRPTFFGCVRPLLKCTPFCHLIPPENKNNPYRLGYVAAFERAFLNAFLAGVYENGKSGAFFVRSSGRHYVAEPQVETKYQNCCLNNVGRGFANAAEIICSESGGEYFVNTYIQSKVRFGDVKIKISNGYVDRGIACVSVRGAKAGTVLNLAVPQYADGLKLMIDGAVTEYKNGDLYARLTLDGNDTLIYVTILHTPRIVDFTGEYIDLPDNDYHVSRWCDSMMGVCDRSKMVKHPMSVIYYGPILLARSKRVGSTASDMFSGKTVCGKGAKLTVTPVRHLYLLAAFKVKLETEDETLEYTMCDYSSAGNSDLEEAEYFTVFV